MRTYGKWWLRPHIITHATGKVRIQTSGALFESGSVHRIVRDISRFSSVKHNRVFRKEAGLGHNRLLSSPCHFIIHRNHTVEARESEILTSPDILMLPEILTHSEILTSPVILTLSEILTQSEILTSPDILTLPEMLTQSKMLTSP